MTVVREECHDMVDVQRQPDVGKTGSDHTRLGVDICGVSLRNPILTASGTFAYGLEMKQLQDLSRLGGIVTKTITREPRKGNPAPRVVETSSGLLNSIGLANPGIERFKDEYLPVLTELGCRIVVNIAGESEKDFILLAEEMSQEDGVDAIELNLSCPNVSGGLNFGIDPHLTESLVRNVKKVCDMPMLSKLTPNVTDIAEIAEAVENGGGDIVSMTNTVLGMAIDPKTRRTLFARGTAGLSGPAIKPIALAAVWRTSKRVSIPIIGIGGISSGMDVVEFMLAGASAVQVGTANFVDPWAAEKMIAELEEYCLKENVDSLADLIGYVDLPEER
jgi:dihydroorotate dehydrogenase (NAD+) catalytic subunit